MVNIARELETALGDFGPTARWAFLLGAWGAVFSSLLGVWQSIPYMFADFWFFTRRPRGDRQGFKVDTKSLPYQAYLYGIALIPIIGLVMLDFKTILKAYAIVGAAFIPMLAIVLLVLNGRAKWVGTRQRNSFLTTLILIGTLVFSILAGSLMIHGKFFPSPSPSVNAPQSAAQP